MDQHGQCAVSLISAPSGANTCIKGGVSLSEGEEAIDTVVVCANEECKFACRLHKTCLELWKMCAEAHMQGLAKAATTINSASLPPGFGDCSGNFRQFSDAFTALKRLLDCPECGTSRLRLARMTDKGSLQAKPFNSLLDEAVILFSLLSQADAGNDGPRAAKQTSASPMLSNQSVDETHQLATHFAGLMLHAGGDSGSGGVCELDPRSPPLLVPPTDPQAKTATIALPQQSVRRLRGSNQAPLRHNNIISGAAAPEEEDLRATPRPSQNRFSDTAAPPSSHLLRGGTFAGGGALHYSQGGPLSDQVGGGSAFPCDAMVRQGKRCNFFKQQKQKQRFAPGCHHLCAAMTSASTSGIASDLSSSSISFRSQDIPSLSSLDSLGQESECNLVENSLTPESLSADWYFWATMSKEQFTTADFPTPAQYPQSDFLASTGFSHSLGLQSPCSDAADAKVEKTSFKHSVSYNCSAPVGTTNDFHPSSGAVIQNYDSQCEHSSNVRPTTSQPPNHVMRSYSINLASLHSAKKPNSKGNIFRQRKDFSAFQALHPSKKNGYFIQLEDDSCTGNEDTRSFLLCQLTNHGASELYCLACGLAMPVYDHFPVVDGALFLSPICHQPQQGSGNARCSGAGLQVVWTSPPSSAFSSGPSGAGNCNASPQAGQVVCSLAPPPGCTGPRQQQSQIFFGSSYRHRQSQPVCQERYLHAICMTCMRSTHSLPNSPGSPSPLDSISASSWSTTSPPQIICRFCATPWDGSTLLIGGLYTYDLFASSPCCPDHLKCKSCGRMALSSHKTRRAESFAGTTPNGWTAAVDEKPRRMSEGAQEEPSSLSPLLPLPFFSQYSNRICCQHCRSIDYHFIKAFNEAYTVIFPHNNTGR